MDGCFQKKEQQISKQMENEALMSEKVTAITAFKYY